MRDVLFFSHFFPPMGGGAVQRALKFVKYLPRYGWRPVVLAGRGDYHLFDETLRSEVPGTARVIRVGGWWGSGRTLWGRAWRRVVRRRRAETAFPDGYASWGEAAARAALAAAADLDVAAVFSTAPPFSSHVAAARVARELALPLVLDYRDAWVGNPFRVVDDARAERERLLENEVLGGARAVVVVTAGMAEAYQARVGGGVPVYVITNGFDEEDFAPPPPATAGGPFEIVYAGQFYEGRMPWSFLEALKSYRQGRPSQGAGVKATFIGPVARGVAARVRDYGGSVVLTGPLDHGSTIAAIRRADANLLIIGDQPGAETTLTGKVFEYLRAGKPILALVPPAGEAARLIRRADAGLIVPPGDVAAIAGALAVLVAGGKKPAAPPPSFIGEYERSFLTRKLAAVLERAASYG